MSKFEYARQLAAALAYLMISQRDAVGLITFDTRHPLDDPGLVGPVHFSVLCKSLSDARVGGETPLSGILHGLAERIRRRGLVIVMSDGFDKLDELTNALQHLRHRRHEVLFFHVLAPEEEEFPFRRPARFRNLEKLDQRLLVDPAAHAEGVPGKVQQVSQSPDGTHPRDGGGLPQGVDGGAPRSDDSRLPGDPYEPGSLRVTESSWRCPVSWGLLHWGMLAGLAGAAIPVLIHLLNRRRTTVVDWGAMQFLELGRRARLKFQLSELLLMAGRMALLAIVALALARPFWVASQPEAHARRRGSRVVRRRATRRRARDRRVRQHGPQGGSDHAQRSGAFVGQAVDREARARRLGCRARRARPRDAPGCAGQLRYEEESRQHWPICLRRGERATCRWPWPRRCGFWSRQETRPATLSF